jgi:hypothetical protein
MFAVCVAVSISTSIVRNRGADGGWVNHNIILDLHAHVTQ